MKRKIPKLINCVSEVCSSTEIRSGIGSKIVDTFGFGSSTGKMVPGGGAVGSIGDASSNSILQLKTLMIDRQRRGVHQLTGPRAALPRLKSGRGVRSVPRYEKVPDLTIEREASLDTDPKDFEVFVSSLELQAFKTSRIKFDEAEVAKKAEDALHQTSPLTGGVGTKSIAQTSNTRHTRKLEKLGDLRKKALSKEKRAILKKKGTIQKHGY